jgi:hypothetical protein
MSAPARLALAAGVALVALAAGAGSAHAAVAALQQVAATSPTNSSDKSVTATCPPGKRVTGAGGSINNHASQVTLRQLRPNATLTSVTAQAAEDQSGLDSNWEVIAYAICATPPAGLELVAATSPTNSSDKSVIARCPGTKRVLGTGGELAGAPRQVSLNDIVPGAELGSVTVQGLEDGDGTTANWSVTAHAICANPVAGRERRVGSGPSNSMSPKGVLAECPAGKHLTGLGAEASGGGAEVVPRAMIPVPNQRASVFASEDEDGTPANWLVRSFAICAAASERVVTTTPSGSNDKGDIASCPAGKQVTGGGAELTGGLGQVVIDDLTPLTGDPDPFSTEVLALGVEDEDGTAANWSLSIYAICVTPLPGLEVVSDTAPPSSEGKLAFATCPPGKRVVGAGGEIDAGSAAGEVFIDNIRPNTPPLNAAPTVVTVSAFEDETGVATDWTVTAHAVCANPPPGLELVTVTADRDSDPASVTATCPSGKNLLGAAAEVDSGTGTNIVIDDLRPNALLTSVTVTGLEDQTGTQFDWAPRAHAICANA